MNLHMNSKLRAELTEGWEAERGNWEDWEVDRCLAALSRIPDGAEIPMSDDADIDETEATDVELIGLGIDYMGIHHLG